MCRAGQGRGRGAGGRLYPTSHPFLSTLCSALQPPSLPAAKEGEGLRVNLWGSRPLTDSGLQDPITTRGPQHPSARRQHRENPETFRVWTPPLRPRTERNKCSSPKAALKPANLLKVARAQQPGLHSALDFEKAPDLQALVSWVPQRLGRDLMGIGGGNPAPWCVSSRRTGAAFTDEAQSQPSAAHSRCSPTSTRSEGTTLPPDPGSAPSSKRVSADARRLW